MELYSSDDHFTDFGFPFNMIRHDIQKNEVVHTHQHDFYEMVYVFKGKSRHELANHVYELSPGDVFFIEPEVSHSYIGDEHTETIIYNVIFQKSLLQQDLDILCQIPAFTDFFFLAPFLRKSAAFYPHFSIYGHDKDIFESHLIAIMNETNQKKPGYQLIIKTRFIECLVHLSRFHEQILTRKKPDQEHPEWLGTIISFLKQHYDQAFTLEQLSSMCGMSVSSFTTKFKNHTGKTLKEFKHDMQIEYACHHLKETNLKIVDICYHVGFDDLSFFYKVFRKKMKMTPLQYRKKYATY